MNDRPEINNKDRVPGYYWCKQGGEWGVYEYTGHGWVVPSETILASDGYMDDGIGGQIDERQIIRTEL